MSKTGLSVREESFEESTILRDQRLRGRTVNRENARRLKSGVSAMCLLGFDLLAYFLCAGLSLATRILLEDSLPGLGSLAFHPVRFLAQGWIPLIYVGFIGYQGLYFQHLPFWDEPRELIKALWIATIIVFAIVTLGKMQGHVSRVVVLLVFGYGIFVFVLVRIIAKRFLSFFGLWTEKVLILGAGAAGVETALGLAKDSHQGYKVVGFLDDDENKIGRCIDVGGEPYKVFAGTRRHREYAALLGVDTVVIAMPSLTAAKQARMVNETQKYFKSVLLVPEIKGTSLLNTRLHHLFMQRLYVIHIDNRLKSLYNRFLKHLFDLLVSTILLPVLLIVVGAFGLLIRLDSPGPVFYRHKRVGRHGRKIRIWKFRTMHVDANDRLEELLESDPCARAEWERSFKLKDDPRITRIGRFLRQTSLDELPQVFNVLIGEMSLVGPRPVIQEELDRFYKEYAEYYSMVRPGITGLWQVSGRSNTTYEHRVWLDTWYVMNWTLWLDVVMLLKTIGTLVKKEGAY
jgi:Undecaprenyl-phosphate galactose phosphotransferase WbaP